MNVSAQRVHASRTRLDSTFERVAAIPVDQIELRSDCSRYLCVLVSGFLETSVIALVVGYAQEKAQPRVARLAERKLSKTTNLNGEKLSQFIGHLDPDWETELRKYLADERKAALDSLVNLRHQVAHGSQPGVSLATVKEYYKAIGEIVEYLQDLLG